MEINSLRKLTELGHKTSLLCPVRLSGPATLGHHPPGVRQGFPHTLSQPWRTTCYFCLKDQKVYINRVYWKVYIYFYIWWEENISIST